ncbi:MAG: PEGA domain-containing protein [Deltaproteobacteria bacterium]|nr:PEGA domain-containing protein [Deltaproteobacteria bacterium]MBN2783797.1 PEGA domain-containing protein [Pontiellaceae bacterium]
MKTHIAALICLSTILAGCTSYPIEGKIKTGCLYLKLMTGKNDLTQYANVYIDDLFIGTFRENSTRMDLTPRRGKHTVRVELEGFKPFEKEITIFGLPHQQELNIKLERMDAADESIPQHAQFVDFMALPSCLITQIRSQIL